MEGLQSEFTRTLAALAAIKRAVGLPVMHSRVKEVKTIFPNYLRKVFIPFKRSAVYERLERASALEKGKAYDRLSRQRREEKRHIVRYAIYFIL